MSSKDEIKELLRFTENIARKAGKILIQEKDVKIVKYKDIKDIATSADINSENFLIESIQKKYPNHGIISEERREINGSSPYHWIIDPLDGTKEYFRKIPLFNV